MKRKSINLDLLPYQREVTTAKRRPLPAGLCPVCEGLGGTWSRYLKWQECRRCSQKESDPGTKTVS